MGYVYRREIPIYLQLTEIMKKRLINGSYHAGDRLPSIREMALEYDVTPNTIQRALTAFEQDGIILTERTNGKYITSEKEKLQELRNEYLHESVQSVVKGLLENGFSKDEITQIFFEEMGLDEK